jgi:tetratricopeptide (TPR) repeat protein
MTKLLIFLLSGLFVAGLAKAQIQTQLYSGKQEMFLEAESYLLFNEYGEALPIYLELLSDQPDNAFLNYRAGICYINIPGQKHKAVEYLEKAIEDIDPRERRPTHRTIKAPPDVLFHLGNAYHINYMFDEALEMYQRFRKNLNQSVYSIEVVDDHIMASGNAIKSIRQPAFFIAENLGERINTRYPETHPAISGDEKSLIFTRKLPFYDGIFYSVKTEKEEWSWPVEITAQLGSDGDCHPVSLSHDGGELYLFKSDNQVGNLYVSHLVDDRWTTAGKLNRNINTLYWESHASLSGGGDTLYFTSNRPGGYGGLDIYYSVKEKNGDWGPAVNLGPEVNSAYNEDIPAITEDGRTLYFSSHGHHNIGGYDIFQSARRRDGKWSGPSNAGYGISTPDDDLFFTPVKNGKFAYLSKYDDKGFGDMDIYRYQIFSEINPRTFFLRGRIQWPHGIHPDASARINVVEPVTRDTLFQGRPDRLTGEFEILVGAGRWEVIFSERDHEDVTRIINIAADRQDPVIRLDASFQTARPAVIASLADPGIDPDVTSYDHPVADNVTDNTMQIDSPEVIMVLYQPAENEITEEIPGIIAPDSVLKPEYYETPGNQQEIPEPGRIAPVWWILILALLLLAAIYYKQRSNRNRKRP